MSPKSSEYIQRINRVLDYVDRHYAEALTLEQLAAVANFSPYHFHRIFRAVVGEPLYKYVQRTRIERAARSILFQKRRSVTEIALENGFSSAASFARAFKEHFGVSATEWRKGTPDSYSKNRKADSKPCEAISNAWKDAVVSPMYIDPTTNNPQWRINVAKLKAISVEVRTLPDIPVAYIRHIGPFKGETAKWMSLFQKLTKWAGARGLLKCPGSQFFTVFRDDLNLTDFSKFKADLCVSVEPSTKGDGEVGVSSIPGGKYAIASFEINANEYEQAWDLMFREWLPQSGYQPDNRCCFERYLNDPKTHPKNKHLIEVCIPVAPL